MKGFADLCDSTAWSRIPQTNKVLLVAFSVLALLLGLSAFGSPHALASQEGPDQAAGIKPGKAKIPSALTFCYQGQVSNPRLLVVDKSRQRMMFFRYLGEMVLEYEYPCATGESEGDKLKAGDERTPEGIYFTTHRYRDNKVTIFGDRALHLNYPNAFDWMEGREGNGIYIHGTNRVLKPRSSNGCVVMRNADLAAISALVKENVTPVVVVNILSWPNRSRRIETCGLLDKIDLVALDKTPGKYESAVALTSEQPAEKLIKTYARKLEALQTVLGKKIKVKTIGMALFGLGNQWVLLVDQELTGPKGEAQRVTRRFSLLGENFLEAKVLHDHWVVPDKRSLDKLAAWAPNIKVASVGREKRPAPKAKARPQPSPKKPAAKPAPRKPDPNREIKAMLGEWSKAWQSKRLKTYIGYYASDFRSGKMDRSAWYRQKRYLAKVYKVIRVQAKDVKVRVRGRSATVRFTQYYRSDWHRDVGIKTMQLVYRKGKWQIKSETWRKVHRSSQIMGLQAKL